MCKKLDLGAIIKEHRKRKGITLTRMGEDISISRSFLSKIENNRREVANLYTLVKICSYLDISVNLILENLIETEKNQNKTI